MGQGQWKTVDLTGTKNGINVTFTIPDVPDLETLSVIINQITLYKKTSAPAPTEFSISGTTITLGLAPNSADHVWAQYDIA